MLGILTLKINQGTKFGSLKKIICDHFSCFNGIIKQNIKGTTSSEQYLK